MCVCACGFFDLSRCASLRWLNSTLSFNANMMTLGDNPRDFRVSCTIKLASYQLRIKSDYLSSSLSFSSSVVVGFSRHFVLLFSRVRSLRVLAYHSSVLSFRPNVYNHEYINVPSCRLSPSLRFKLPVFLF